MDFELDKRVKDLLDSFEQELGGANSIDQMDPIAKMMLVAVAQESRKIEDYVLSLGDRLTERFCEYYIPRQNVEAMPALAIVEAKLRAKREAEAVTIGEGVNFTYKIRDGKHTLNFLPLFRTFILPYNEICTLNKNLFRSATGDVNIMMGDANSLWIGIDCPSEVQSLRGLSMMIEGTGGVVPEHIYVGTNGYELEFADMNRVEEIDVLEPFDAQQSSNIFFSIMKHWQEVLLNMGDSLMLYITDPSVDRDIFKPKAYPRQFQNWLESEMLDRFSGSSIWLRMDFPEGYVVPDNCRIKINMLPIVNVEVDSITLTQSSPIAKLQRNDGSFFLQVVETSTAAHKQGFSMSTDEIIVRDFDVASYNNGDLFREVRSLYHHFIDDYYAFIDYNGIKDGDTIKQLRDLVNRIGKGVGNYTSKHNYDSGVYVMKNMNQYPQSSSTRVSYATTLGRLGNSPKVGELVENKKSPLLERELRFVFPGTGGSDKVGRDERYEFLRYYSLTNDRLYTKKDIDGFLRKEIITEFGKEEYRRITIKLKIEGTGGDNSLLRGLYIYLEFKDAKNYEKAVRDSFAQRMHQQILNKSCISLPIVIKLVNKDQ